MTLTRRSVRCWIFTFDSLGAKHEAVVEKLKKYLDMEAKTKLNREWTAINEVRGIAVKVSCPLVSFSTVRSRTPSDAPLLSAGSEAAELLRLRSLCSAFCREIPRGSSRHDSVHCRKLARSPFSPAPSPFEFDVSLYFSSRSRPRPTSPASKGTARLRSENVPSEERRRPSSTQRSIVKTGGVRKKRRTNGGR